MVGALGVGVRQRRQEARGKAGALQSVEFEALVQIEVFAAPAGARFVVAFGEFERRAIADHRSRHIARERFGEIEPAGIERGRHGVDELRRNHHVGVDQADGCGSRGGDAEVTGARRIEAVGIVGAHDSDIGKHRLDPVAGAIGTTIIDDDARCLRGHARQRLSQMTKPALAGRDERQQRTLRRGRRSPAPGAAVPRRTLRARDPSRRSPRPCPPRGRSRRPARAGSGLRA